METIMGAIFCAALIAVVIISGRMRKKSLKKIYEQFQEKDFAYTLVFGGYDWGPGTEKIILNTGNLTEEFSKEDLLATSFGVSVKTEIYDKEAKSVFEKEKSVEVKNAYFCDIDGNPLSKKETAGEDESEDEVPTHIALELEAKPDDVFTNPFLYDEVVMHNRWKNVYEFTITHPKFEKPMTDCSDWYSPETNRFKHEKPCGQLTAASFVPENAKDGKLHPLIIWLHGAGEGGTNPDLVVLGNKVSALSHEKIQSYFGGAFILCPQTPTFWMQHGDSPYDIELESTTDKSSRYTKDCKKLIDRFLKKNKAIDKSRIYIAGCSNGGYMTMNLLMTYPNFFAGAVPVAESYRDKWISEDKIKTLTNIPIWFVAAKGDDTVIPEDNLLATTKRLKDLGSKIHMNYFDSVTDKTGKYFGNDGNPYKYFSHWSWIPVLNDECDGENGLSVWDWLSRQKKN